MLRKQSSAAQRQIQFAVKTPGSQTDTSAGSSLNLIVEHGTQQTGCIDSSLTVQRVDANGSITDVTAQADVTTSDNSKLVVKTVAGQKLIHPRIHGNVNLTAKTPDGLQATLPIEVKPARLNISLVELGTLDTGLHRKTKKKFLNIMTNESMQNPFVDFSSWSADLSNPVVSLEPPVFNEQTCHYDIM